LFAPPPACWPPYIDWRTQRHEQAPHLTGRIANLSKCEPEEIAAIKLAFEHKHDLDLIVEEGINKLATLCDHHHDQ
jgi:hypothetical protein